VFGAGASAPQPYKVPAQKDMLKEFFKRNFPGREQRQQNILTLKQDVKDDCLFVLPGAKPEEVSLEEIFSAYELMLSEPRTPLDLRERAQAALVRLKQAIQYSTYTLGRGDSKKWRPHDRGQAESPYAELLEKLYPANGNAVDGEHGFVTFNYDINLDRCLINLRDAANVDLDYGIAMANERTSRAPEWKNPQKDRKSALLLRIHGALNWLRCDACYSLFTTVNRHAYVKGTSRCWACGNENIDNVIVHPTYIRAYEDPVIKLVWGRCQEELVLSDRWIFVGYSLPMADVHFRELLRHCWRSREKAGRKTEIMLIGRKQPNGELINKDVYRNYVFLFGDAIQVWDGTQNGFSDLPAVIVP
jgi:hypothetical protein